MRTRCAGRKQRNQRGFSLLEVMIAILVMFVGVISVAQLVPAALWLNTSNREDSSALIYAQREMDQFVDQPLNGNSVCGSSPCFIDQQGFTCNLGSTSSFNTRVGNNVITLNGRAAIDFTGSQVSGYGYYYSDPQDTTGTIYDVRWAVISTGTAGNVTSRRFILGVRKQGGEAPLLPVTLDTTVEK